MLALARTKLPNLELLEGDLRSLLVADASVDLVVCSPALTARLS